MSSSEKYTAKDSIQVLEGLEPVRVRPSMYIGSTDAKGLHHLCWEIIDNAVDEYLNGHGDTVTVTLHKHGDAITVADNGRGIPVDIHPKFKKPGIELILTTLHSGGKFGEGDAYIHSGGLHGVGSSVVNALSKKLVARIRKDGFEWEMKFSKGKPTTKLEKLNPFRGHGTSIYFEPDDTIFRVTHFDADEIKTRLIDMSFIHNGLKFIFKDDAKGEVIELYNPGGLPDFLNKLVADDAKKPIVPVLFHASRENGEKIHVALQWTDATDEYFRAYANGIRNPNGGTHEAGFKSAIVKAVRNYMETHKKGDKKLTITAEDIREGIVGIVSVFLREPKFEAQTKVKLQNPEIQTAVDGFVRPALETWFNANQSVADEIIGRIMVAARARMASREAAAEVKRKSPSSTRLRLPGKLADCKSTDMEETELFIVEGDSAGGSAKQGRDNRVQAVLPLRGKILNGEGLTTAKTLQNQELADLVSAIGTGAGDKFNVEGLRYGKIILLMDADADGHHISTLMLDFFFRHMPELIKKGHVFIAQPPLYRIDVGKETHWAKDDNHKEAILAKLRQNAKYEISRFKGLGEMDAKVLKETTLDRRTRILLKVEIENTLAADQIFDQLLGKDPNQRYIQIMANAAKVSSDEIDV